MNFEDPDAEVDSKFLWHTDFQKSILSLLLKDRYFLVQGLDLIKPFYFTERVHQIICNILFDYFEKYKHIPKETIIREEIENIVSDKAPGYIVELKSLLDYYDIEICSRDYYLNQITNFAKIEALKIAFNKCLKMFGKNDNDTWTKIYDTLKTAMLVDKSFDLGLDYFNEVQERYDRMQQEEEQGEIFTSGFDNIDRSLRCGGLRRGHIGAYMGISGGGKSLALVRAAVKNFEKGKKVLYISLEMSEDEVAVRFDAQLANVPINFLMQEKSVVFENLNKQVIDYDDKTLIVIKQFPSGTADVNTIKAYVVQAQMCGFSPDVLIVDYIGEMKDFPGMPLHDSREKIVKELRGFASEMNIVVLTALQPNRGARDAVRMDSGVIDDDMLADSFGQTRPLHCLWSLNSNDKEKELYIGRIFVIKHRDGKSRFHVYYQTDPNTLMMMPIEKETYMAKRNVAIETVNKEISKNKIKFTEKEPDLEI